ncbi:GatB/YqeY domain-containing protein [Albibacterium sp.]|uniref:GatB/YqeY domain-containing protein n=1 Tax=Albibacterium sp. TaxID=2952885 RepID=UPI002CB51E0F|nr:GatB/YqeY domain-containing protein [Albibacterium sp.]HUH17910.1 GatB/YqeY domain-containing protein [Albibacterium sp.]
MALKNQIDQDIKTAMLAKDQARLRGLRAIKSAILVAETEKNAGVFNEESEIKVLQRLIKQRKESAEIYQQQNRPDLYAIEKEEQDVIESYLPQQLDKDEIRKIILSVVKENGFTSIKDMGKVMGMSNKILAGKADGKTISEIVKEVLIP